MRRRTVRFTRFVVGANAELEGWWAETGTSLPTVACAEFDPALLVGAEGGRRELGRS